MRKSFVFLGVVGALIGASWLANRESAPADPTRAEAASWMDRSSSAAPVRAADGRPMADAMNPSIYYGRDGFAYDMPKPVKGNLQTKAEIEAEAKAAKARADAAARAAAMKNPEAGLNLQNVTWHLGGFNVVAIATFTVKSTNDFPTRDIEFSCTSHGASGTALSRVTHTVYDVVQAKGTKVFRDVNLGFVSSQSATLSCRISDART